MILVMLMAIILRIYDSIFQIVISGVVSDKSSPNLERVTHAQNMRDRFSDDRVNFLRTRKLTESA